MKSNKRVFYCVTVILTCPVDTRKTMNHAKTAVFEDAVFAARTAKKEGFLLVGIYDVWEPEQELLKKTADIYLKTWSEWK